MLIPLRDSGLSRSDLGIGYFPVLKDILDGTIGQSHGALPSRVAECVRRLLEHMSREYHANRRPIIPYCDMFCRAAYLYSSLPIHAAILRQELENCPGLSEFLDERVARNGRLRVCAFGGGPGPEALALANFYHDRKVFRRVKLDVTVVDRVYEWDDSFQQLRRSVERRLDIIGAQQATEIELIERFKHFDMTRIENYSNAPSLFDHDLFVLNFVISELFDQAAQYHLAKVLSLMGQRAPHTSRLMIVDLPYVANRVDAVVRTAEHWKIEHSEVHATKTVPRHLDDKQVIANYIAQIGPWPRTYTPWSCVVARRMS